MPMSFDQLVVQLIRTHPERYWSRGDVLTETLLYSQYPLWNAVSFEWTPDGRIACPQASTRHATYGNAPRRPGIVHLPDFLTCPDPSLASLAQYQAFWLEHKAPNETPERTRSRYETLCRVREEAEERARVLYIYPDINGAPGKPCEFVPGGGWLQEHSLATSVPDNVAPDYLDAVLQALDLISGYLGTPSAITPPVIRLRQALHTRFPARVPPHTPDQACYLAGQILRMQADDLPPTDDEDGDEEQNPAPITEQHQRLLKLRMAASPGSLAGGYLNPGRPYRR